MNITELLSRKILALFPVFVAMFVCTSQSFGQHELELKDANGNVTRTTIKLAKPLPGVQYFFDADPNVRFLFDAEHSSFAQLEEAQAEDEIDRSLISNYWIGVQGEKAGSTNYSPAEAPKIELTVPGGIKILAVTKGSASEEAGLKEGDVLLRFSDQKTDSLNDLYAVIGETKDRESEIVLIRDGKIITSEITPQERPEEKNEFELHEKATGLWTITDAYNAELQSKQIPEGHRIQVELVRGKEIKLNIVNGDDTWQADSNSIEELPKSIQPLAKEIVVKCKPLVEPHIAAIWSRQIPTQNFHEQLNQIGARMAERNRIDSIEQKISKLTKAIEALSSKMDD